MDKREPIDLSSVPAEDLATELRRRSDQPLGRASMQSEPMQSDKPFQTLADVRGLIRNRIGDMRHKIGDLEALADMLPAKIPLRVAELLFDLIEKHS